ncbi:uncharacterized protein BKCO1_6000145 [Diplodia corticola]|uniref:Uncharacterized protein n=1 Tax=Diplodia corticola TaxID=236234 RepID=A0A1J9RAS8_9PEZI|nr:uncharacterized protein BKCO1_6000145 [Diplodia corticola]OJD37577.1 hypothetical protein BKCO1_6000145 [Diplodia corticola]
MGRPRKKRRRSVDEEGGVPTNGDAVPPMANNGVGRHGVVGNGGRMHGHGGGMMMDMGHMHATAARSMGVGAGGGMDVGVGMEGMGFDGFEGLGCDGGMENGCGEEGERGERACGAHAAATMNGEDAFELNSDFSLDSLLTGDLMDVMGGSGSGGSSSGGGFDGLQQGGDRIASISSHSSSGNGHNLQSTPPAAHHHDPSTQHQPFLAPQPPLGLPCVCLSTIYLSLSSLHSLSSHEFPFSLPPLRSALATANTVLHCQMCPHAMATATLNINMLISLLMTVIDAVHKLLVAIDAEAARVDAAGATKPFMVADASAPLHMHTGGPNCPVKFGMDLSGAEWRELARKVVKRQVVGSSEAEAERKDEGSAAPAECTIYGMLAAFVRRQNRWHDDPAMIEVRKKAIADGGASIEKMEELSHMKLCVQNVEAVVMRMRMLDI